MANYRKINKQRGGAKQQPKNPRGKQHLTQLRDKMYIKTLQQNGRSTPRQVNDVIGGSLNGTLQTLKRMLDLDLIGGEKVGYYWEFWAHQDRS